MTGTWQDTGTGGAGDEPTPKVVVTIEIFDWAPGQSRIMWRGDEETRMSPEFSAENIVKTVIREAGRAL